MGQPKPPVEQYRNKDGWDKWRVLDLTEYEASEACGFIEAYREGKLRYPAKEHWLMSLPGHPACEKINKAIADLGTAEKELEQAANEFWKTWRAEWGYVVKVDVAGVPSWSQDPPVGTETVTILATLLNEDELLKGIHYFKSGPGLDKVRRSRKYYRVNNVLLAAGGGYTLLASPRVMMDEQWEGLKAGNVEPYLSKNG